MKKNIAQKKSIEESTIDYVLAHPDFRKELDQIASAIRKIAATAPNEATLATNFELKLYGQINKRLHIEFEPVKEESIDTARHIAKGRIDSRIGALVIEYKQKRMLTTVAQKASAVSQLKNYLESLPKESQQGAVGVVTDGHCIKFCTYQGESGFAETPFEILNADHLLRLIRGILSLDKRALTPKNLIEGFCVGDPSPVKSLSLALFDALKNNPTPRSEMLFREWRAIFKLAHDDTSKQSAIEDRRQSLAEALDITIRAGDNDTEYQALYAIQTAYAIIIKVIAFKVLLSIRFDQNAKTFSDFAEGTNDSLRGYLDRLESGEIFREEGFCNLLEGDFFAWYCSTEQWNKSIANAASKVFGILAEYENHHMFDSANVQDLFKDLYMAIIPDKVRHSMGEFYTPAWLAEHTIIEALAQAGRQESNYTALDPCCGSGTFITVLIRMVLDQVSHLSKPEQLRHVLNRVKGIDLNPLAALTTRINYFINLAHLIEDDDAFEVPIYLGDASYVPSPSSIGRVKCVEYQISTEKGPLNVMLPQSAVADVNQFSKTMTELEVYIANEDESAVSKALQAITDPKDLTGDVKTAIDTLSKQLVDLQRNKWNGIWARIISNFLTTANLGRFDIVVGNPPWIDWKNLPEGYRRRLVDLCISRHLFSGDGGITGGINLNVCALIANVSAQNWLKPKGALGFLMPESLIFQQSYEGFRKIFLNKGKRLYFQKFVDWTNAGHPFSPVQHRFLSYFIGEAVVNYKKGIPVDRYIKKKNNKKEGITPLREHANTARFSLIEHMFEKTLLTAVTPIDGNTAFSLSDNVHQSQLFASVAGECSYAGHDGISVYPQELFLLKVESKKLRANEKVLLTNFQNPRAKHRIGKGRYLLEAEFLHPLVRGVDIERFHVRDSGFVVPFPYDSGSRAPIDSSELASRAPSLMKYLNNNRDVFVSQSRHNSKIIGDKYDSEFYALPRVGVYSYAKYFVAFRHNTKWRAAVVSDRDVPWEGDAKRPVFQSHACTISQRADGGFISEAEAHFICAIFNAPIVERYIVKSSDPRSFKVRPRIMVPPFDPENSLHTALEHLSRLAHECFADQEKMIILDKKLDETYLALLAGL